MPITNKDLTKKLLSIPEIAAWPQMANVFTDTADKARLDWQLPALACQAMGESEDKAFLGVLAIACLQISIILVDDILDDDPRGEHLKSNAGNAANLGVAFQAAALRVFQDANMDASRCLQIQTSLADMALKTAFGQWLDVQNLIGEENYWKVVEAKSTPFYATALHIGSLLGNANPETADTFHKIGCRLGEIIQIFDDLDDALQIPASPDWIQGRNNLLILYAKTANHSQQERFVEISRNINNTASLQSAQQILVDSGAVSYAIYQILQRHQNALQLLDSISLPQPHFIKETLKQQILPLVELFNRFDLPVPPDLFD